MHQSGLSQNDTPMHTALDNVTGNALVGLKRNSCPSLIRNNNCYGETVSSDRPHLSSSTKSKKSYIKPNLTVIHNNENNNNNNNSKIKIVRDNPSNNNDAHLKAMPPHAGPPVSLARIHLHNSEKSRNLNPNNSAANSSPSAKFAKKWKWLLKKYRHHKTLESTEMEHTVDNSHSYVIPSKHNVFSSDESPPSVYVQTENNQQSINFRDQRNSSVPELTLLRTTSGWSVSPGQSPNRSIPFDGNPNPLDADHLSITTNRFQSRGKSSSPVATASTAVSDRRDQLQRGASLSFTYATVSRDQQNKSPIIFAPSSSDREDRTPDREPDGPWVKGTIERLRRTKLTGEMRDKKFFHKSPNANPHHTFQSPGSAQSNSRVILNKLFRSNWPSLADVERWGQSFSNILHDKAGIILFREFLRTEFSDENIEFWLTCEDFRNSSGSKKLHNKAQKIFNEFVAVQSKREVNLDSSTRNQLEKDLESVTRNTFDQSQKRIQALMEKDSYCRFLRSELYTATLEHCRELSQLPCACHTSRASTLWKLAVPKVQLATSHEVNSAIPGLLPDVKSPKAISTSANQHQTGSFSAPSSPKQQPREPSHTQTSNSFVNRE